MGHTAFKRIDIFDMMIHGEKQVERAMMMRWPGRQGEKRIRLIIGILLATFLLSALTLVLVKFSGPSQAQSTWTPGAAVGEAADFRRPAQVADNLEARLKLLLQRKNPICWHPATAWPARSVGRRPSGRTFTMPVTSCFMGNICWSRIQTKNSIDGGVNSRRLFSNPKGLLPSTRSKRRNKHWRMTISCRSICNPPVYWRKAARFGPAGPDRKA